MDINKGKLVYIKDKSLYNSNNFLDTLVIFVEDTKEIITHGISFAGIPSSYSMYVGAKDKKANAITTNGNTYIKLYKDSTLNNQFLIKGTGATTVVSDASGNITINSTDNNTWRALQVKGTQIAGTGTGTYPVNFVEGTDITLTGTAGTSTTKLNSITINHADITTTVTAAKDTATQLSYSGEITVPTAITTNNGHITAYTWTKYKLPAASHYTTRIYAGTSGTNANSTNDVSNPYLTVVDNTTYRNQVQFAGSGATSVKAKNGVITISSTNTWTAFVGAKTNAAGTAGYVPAPSSGLTGLYFRSDGTWATPTDTKYTLPTASSSTLGGVKTGAAIDSTSGYTAVHINNGVIYYKNTTYSTKAMKVNGSTYNVYTSSTSLPTIYAPTAVGTAGQVLATNSNADGLEWKSVATTTKAMKVNGTNYNIYTTGTSLPTIYAPTSLGTAGQVLKMNGDGTGFTWATDATIANTWRPVKALKSDGSTLGTLSDNSTTLSLKAGSNITLAYSSGTITITGVGNTWTALGGATASADGTAGYAPKPTKGQQGYYLKGNATWVKPSLSEFTDDVVAGKYLPLSGGTLTGPLDIFGELYNGNYGINMNNSDIINVNSITLADTCNAAGEGIKFVRTDNKYDSIWAIDGTLYFSTNGTLSTQTTTGSFANNYSVYHSGNCTLLDATRLCSAYGTSTPNNMDNRPTSANVTFYDKSVRYFLATSSMTTGKPSNDAMIIHTAWDNVGWNAQLAIPSGITHSIQWRNLGDGTGNTSSATVWNNWKTILDSSNYTSYCATAGHTHSYLPLSGGNMTGPISYTGTQATHQMIKFVDNTIDQHGNGISIGGGGLVIIGSGESTNTILLDTALALFGGTETTYITSDNDIVFYSNCQTSSASKKTMTFDINGYLKAPKFLINLNDSSGNWGAEFVDGTGAIGCDGTNNYVLPQRGTSFIRSGNTDLYHRKNGTDYVILDSSNRASYCLPISGGTLTGPLTLPANMYGTEGALNMNNSNILNVNAIFTSDNAEDAGEGIQFARSNGNYDSIWCSGGVFYFSPNGGTASQAYTNNYTVIHSGNYTSYLSGGSWNGGTVSNEITISRAVASSNTFINCKRTDTGYGVNFGVGSGGVNRGVWDDYFGKWVLYSDASKTYITNNVQITQDAWNNGLTLNRSVSGGGASIRVLSNGTYLGEFGINGSKQFEVDVNGSTVMICDSGGNLNVSGSISIAGNKLTFVT